MSRTTPASYRASSSQDEDTYPIVDEWDFTGTTRVPVYVKLPSKIINKECELVDPHYLTNLLTTLKSINVDGVMLDTWWGIVEANNPQDYNWKGYKQLFSIVCGLGLKLQVVMSFHESGDIFCIPLPKWIEEIGQENPDIYFTDRDGRRNTESLTWGIDEEPVLRGRTALEVYFDYMRSFWHEFNEFFQDGSITIIQIGLGACGELRYPSNPAKHGWKYRGIGEFQCYDKYLSKCLEKAAEARGHSIWGRPPDNAGSYNSTPQGTGFFCDGGDYNSPYGRFFLNWYSQCLIDHGDRVLAKARLAFEGVPISVKLSGIHWWYETASHAAELTAGIYNPANHDGYAPIALMLKKHKTTLNLTCADLRTMDRKVHPEGLFWQVLNAAWDADIPVASECALAPESYGFLTSDKILEHSKPRNDLDRRHSSAFTYTGPTQALLEQHNFKIFQIFVKRMHGEALEAT